MIYAGRALRHSRRYRSRERWKQIIVPNYACANSAARFAFIASFDVERHPFARAVG